MKLAIFIDAIYSTKEGLHINSIAQNIFCLDRLSNLLTTVL